MKYLFLLLPFVYFLGNGYLFWRVWQTMVEWPLWGKIIATLLFWLIAGSLFLVIGLREMQLPDGLLRPMFNIGAVWMVFLLYMVLLLGVFGIVKVFIPAMGNTLGYALVTTVCLLLYGYFNYKHPRVEYIDVSLEKEFEGNPMRIVAVSDVHLGYGTGLSTLKNYVKLINDQHPDLILITGDLIDNSLKPLLHEPFDEVLSTLHAPMGIYMVPGNHEYISGMEACDEFLRRTPICLLRDSVVTLPNGVQLVGRDDRTNRRRKSLVELLRQTDERRPVVVLDHQPYRLAQVDSLGVDMQLSGHTHHGQVWPLSLVTDHLYEQSHGYRKWKHTHIWVSSGLSLWGPPFRIGTNSDMAVIELR